MGPNRPVTLDDFAELRRGLVTAEDFDVFWQSFLGNWMENQEFLKMGQLIQSQAVEQITHALATRIFGRPVKAHSFALFLIPHARMIHGVFLVEDRAGHLLYFDEIDMGLMAVAHLERGCDFARFTLEPPPQERPNA